MMETLLPLLQWVHHTPPWIGYTLIGCTLTYGIFATGLIIARTGRSPLWALALLVPVVQIIALWWFALTPFPKEKLPK